MVQGHGCWVWGLEKPRRRRPRAPRRHPLPGFFILLKFRGITCVLGVLAKIKPMADRSIHYEAAFEDLLRQRGIPYVAVDEAKRALFSDARLKSFDYVVYSKTRPNLLVDIKGRRHQGPRASSFQTWYTPGCGRPPAVGRGLRRWFSGGPGFCLLAGHPHGRWIASKKRRGDLAYKSRWYRMFGVDLGDYQQRMRRRSAKWETVAVGQDDFKTLARPIEMWLS